MHAHGHHQPQQGSNKRPRSSFDGSSSGGQQELGADATLAQRLRRQIDNCVRQLSNSTGSSRRGSGVISLELMRRYIEYAKRYVQPALSPGAAKVLQRLYLTMRAQASTGQSIPVTTRHLESLIRLAQARARVDLREEVLPECCISFSTTSRPSSLLTLSYLQYLGYSPYIPPSVDSGDCGRCTGCGPAAAGVPAGRVHHRDRRNRH